MMLTLASGRPAVAQDSFLSLDLGASYSLPPAGGVGVASTYANGGLRVAGPFGSGGFFDAGAVGGLALSAEGADWGSLFVGGGWLQPVSNSASLGIAVMGEAFTVGDPAPYRAAYGAAEPEVRLRFGDTLMRLYGYGGLGTSEVTTVRSIVRDTRFGPRVFEVGFPVTSDLWAWGGGAEIGYDFGRLAPRIAVEGYDSPQGPYVVGRLGLEVRASEGALYIEGSLWDAPDGEDFVIFAGLRVRTGARSAFRASGGRYGPDPLLDSPAAGSLGAGVSLELARFGPVPELGWEILERTPPVLSLVLSAPGASSVECAGTFSGWERVPMLRDGDFWRVALPVTQGVHHFGFFVDGEWYVPEEAPGLTVDEWGEPQATVFVPGPAGEPDVTP